jgi:EAL domain-containing protein (putative c-di-GMP-specific phosphodiesterase class I)
VLEITERALAARPAELLRTVERVRARGWGIALDDVGADPTSLAFMSLLRPDVIKLDLGLVQGEPPPEIAGVMNAVNAYAERSGALILTEGIEDTRRVTTSLALGPPSGRAGSSAVRRSRRHRSRRPARSTCRPPVAGSRPRA